jgi:hypothetical protein
MKTISVPVDDDMFQTIETLTTALHATQAAVLRHAVQLLWQQQMVGLLEEQHRQGYLRHPVGADEFEIDDACRAWGD